MWIDTERAQALNFAHGEAESKTPIEANPSEYYKIFLEALRVKGYTLKKLNILDCKICGNPREIEKKCKECFVEP